MSYNPIITVNTHINDTNLSLKVHFGFSGGDSNLYGYVLGDPVNFVDSNGLKPDNDKVYICTSSNQSDTWHSFLCAGGKCAGLYPSRRFFVEGEFDGSTGETRDDTYDFDNYDKNGFCSTQDQEGEGCDKEKFQSCVKEFTYNGDKVDSYPYNFLVQNCRTVAGTILMKCKLESGCL